MRVPSNVTLLEGLQGLLGTLLTEPSTGDELAQCAGHLDIEKMGCVDALARDSLEHG